MRSLPPSRLSSLGGWRGVACAVAAALALAGALTASRQTFAQSSECVRLQQAIADSGRRSQSDRYQAAAQKQRGEIDRTAGYARSLGCENRKFLFFGASPPAQCGEINAQLSRMQANLSDLEARAGGGSGGRGELVARYNAECGSGATGRQPNIFDAIFGNPPPPAANDMTLEPISPDATPEPSDGAHGGSKAVCVRSCDGYFFPVSYSAGSSRLDSLQDMCSALCPNTEVSLYTYSMSADIDSAVSSSGARYADAANALKYRQSFDSTCTCRKRGQSWADALAGAEQKLGSQGHSDLIVTQAKSVELSRPRSDPKAKTAKPAPDAPKVAEAPAPDQLEKQAGAISRESSGIASGDAGGGSLLTTDKGQTRELVGPDGVKRRVRIIDPML